MRIQLYVVTDGEKLMKLTNLHRPDLDFDVLMPCNQREAPTVFNRRGTAKKQVRHTEAFAKNNNYEWGPWRIVELSSGDVLTGGAEKESQ